MPNKYDTTNYAWDNGFKMGYKKGLKDGAAKWHDIEFDPVPMAGYYLVCFCKWPQVTIAEWRGNEDEGGTFYVPDTDNAFLNVGLMEISIDSQLRRIEEKINTLLEDTFDLLMAKKESDDEQRLDD